MIKDSRQKTTDKTFTFLFIGDIFGGVGRKTVFQVLPSLIDKWQIDFVVANGENATHGRSLSIKHYELLKNVGIDVFTMGNHVFDLVETTDYLKLTNNILRPANYSVLAPGKGSFVFTKKRVKVRVTNLSGRTFMQNKPENPFLVFEKILKDDDSDFHLVDFHAESTAEKIAFAFAFDGQITAFLGTHTHVPTADLRLLPKGSLFITDVGMTGPHHSIIGAQPESIIHSERTSLPFRVVPAAGPGQFCAVLFTVSLKDKKVIQTKHFYQRL